ncbi:MAG: protein translocase SEC61 complex subunit gamma [Candidatus Pacearchaeota archaeon]
MNEKLDNLKAFAMKCRRVWYVLRKPTMKEFEMVTKISAVGILAIGLVGFTISIIMGIFT